jgi:hypothetical protein
VNVDDLLGQVTTALDAAGIPYMLTGSFASSIHGLGRSTYDIDLVVDPTAAGLKRFIAALSPDRYYVSPTAALEALDRRSQFNVIDLETSSKVDLIVRKERPFSRVEFDRRFETVYLGRSIRIATAEDVIIAKLEWAKAGGSARQIEDAAGILKVQPELDRDYLEHWVAELGIGAQWETALSLAGAT